MAPTAARAEPMAKVKATTELVLMPISLAAPVSSEVACMALPILVLRTSSCSPTISSTDTTMLIRVSDVKVMPPKSTGRAPNRVGMVLGSGVKSSINRFCRKMLTPRAVISREIRAALCTSSRR